MEDPRPLMATNSIPSSPGSSSLPSPPSSPQHRAREHVAHHAHHDPHAHGEMFESLPGSPLSITSSFPSGASSYVFSQSASSSPPYIAPHLLGEYIHSRHHTDSETDPLGLVIPSLTLPPLVASAGGESVAGNSTRHSDSSRGRGYRSHRSHHQSPYGETLGNLELFIFGRKGAGKTAVANTLVEGNDDIISSSGWDNSALMASTAWKDSRTRHGVQNVRIVEIDGFDDDDDQASEVLQPLLRTIHKRFEKVASGLAPELPATQQVMDMLASSSSPLPTALIFLLSSPPTPLELTLLSLISTHIPTVTLPPYPPSISSATSFTSIPSYALHSTSTILLGPTSQSPGVNSTAMAPFRPRNTLELRNGLFRNPTTLKALRVAAAERFAHWREIRKACDEMSMSSYIVPQPSTESEPEGRKALSRAEKQRKKKLEWELRLSRDVATAFNATHANAGSGTIRRSHKVGYEQSLEELEEGQDSASQPRQRSEDDEKFERSKERERFLHRDTLGDPDPLHLPTLFRLSAALLGAFGRRLVSSLVSRSPRAYQAQVDTKWREAEELEEGWALTKWGIAGIAFAIGYCAGRFMK